jgi:hypothetical protein
MKVMSSKERVMAALNLKQPDSVPNPDAPNRLGGLEELIEKAKGRVDINFHCRVAFMWSVFLMGMDNLLLSMAAGWQLYDIY